MNLIIGYFFCIASLACVLAELSPRIPTDAVFTKLALAGAAIYGLYMAQVYL
jgi:hypothetical protein